MKRADSILPLFRLFGVVAKCRDGSDLRISTGDYRSQLRVDLREYRETKPGDPDSAEPTERGVNLSAQNLPRLLFLLHEAARVARETGRLTAEDFAAHGLADPMRATATPDIERAA